MKIIYLILITSLFGAGLSPNMYKNSPGNESTDKNIMETATFGAGCFWCVEAIFEELEGVDDVISGYAGGKISNPSYSEVCSGMTGHAEVCRIEFDPSVISYDELLEIFWKTHDPTTLNRQGADIGTQYRSVVFYHAEEHKVIAENYKKALNKSGAWHKPVVTEISPAPEFYEAEAYHQDYFKKNLHNSYCQFVIGPKVEKFRAVFGDRVKEQ